MGKDNGWRRLGELSKILQAFRHMYLHRHAEEDHPSLVGWRRQLRQFLKDLVLSCGLSAREGVEEGTPWVHYHFDTFCSALTHSYCDWSSADAFGCGLSLEVLDALLQAQSELPVCAPAIVQVLLQRLATLRPGSETKRSFNLLVTGLESALNACPAMPGAALEASIESCLRRPSLDASSSLRSTRMFVRGLLSLVSTSQRSLCQSVVPVLVRFVSERECEASDSQDLKEGSPRALPCVSCAGSDTPLDEANAPGVKARPLRCNAHAKRDVVLEGILRWAVDIHFRRCSRVLQASLYRAACDGVRQALDAATVASGRVSPPSFPLACRLLLSFVAGLAGDDGAFVAPFLQKRCAAELLPFVAPANSTPWTRWTEERAVMGTAGLQLPILEGYVGHLCLCRHVSDVTAASHLLWLSRQALVALRLLDNPSPLGTAQHQQQSSGEISAVLRSLSHALALLLTRPMRGNGSASGVPDNAGNLLEILFDSEARPLADLPRPLAEAALGVLQKAGFLQLARSEVLLGSYRARTAEQEVDTAERSDSSVAEPDAKAGVKGDYFSDGVDFRRASFAFNRSWSLAAAGVDSHLPLIKRQRGLEGSGDGDSRDSASENSDEGESDGSWENESTRENGWGSVPDEVALRVFSFMTPKRVCRLMCVDRTWRDLLLVERVWKPLFEARWPLKGMKDGEDLARASEKLLEAIVSVGDAKRKRKRGKSNVVHWQLPEDARTTPPSQDWTALYRDRHQAERAVRGKSAARTNFPWVVCPFLGCVSSLKSEFAVKRHVKTHKRPPEKRRSAKKLSRPNKSERTPRTGRTTAADSR